MVIEVEQQNQRYYSINDAVSIKVAVKNVPKLTVIVYALQPKNYYLQYGREVDIDIDKNVDELTVNCTIVKEFKVNYKLTVNSFLLRSRTVVIHELKKKRGVFLVDMVGNGKRARCLIRKGQLRYIARQELNDNNYVLTVVDEKTLVVDKSCITIGGTTYTSDAKGNVYVPFADEDQAAAPIILEDLSCDEESATLQFMNYHTQGLDLDREAMLKTIWTKPFINEPRGFDILFEEFADKLNAESTATRKRPPPPAPCSDANLEPQLKRRNTTGSSPPPSPYVAADEYDNEEDDDWHSQLNAALPFVRERGRFDGMTLADKFSSTLYELNGVDPSVEEMADLFRNIQTELAYEAQDELVDDSPEQSTNAMEQSINAVEEDGNENVLFDAYAMPETAGRDLDTVVRGQRLTDDGHEVDGANYNAGLQREPAMHHTYSEQSECVKQTLVDEVIDFSALHIPLTMRMEALPDSSIGKIFSYLEQIEVDFFCHLSNRSNNNVRSRPTKEPTEELAERMQTEEPAEGKKKQKIKPRHPRQPNASQKHRRWTNDEIYKANAVKCKAYVDKRGELQSGFGLKDWRPWILCRFGEGKGAAACRKDILTWKGYKSHMDGHHLEYLQERRTQSQGVRPTGEFLYMVQRFDGAALSWVTETKERQLRERRKDPASKKPKAVKKRKTLSACWASHAEGGAASTWRSQLNEDEEKGEVVNEKGEVVNVDGAVISSVPKADQVVVERGGVPEVGSSSSSAYGPEIRTLPQLEHKWRNEGLVLRFSDGTDASNSNVFSMLCSGKNGCGAVLGPHGSTFDMSDTVQWLNAKKTCLRHFTTPWNMHFLYKERGATAKPMWNKAKLARTNMTDHVCHLLTTNARLSYQGWPKEMEYLERKTLYLGNKKHSKHGATPFLKSLYKTVKQPTN